jgi:hypothetical protein
MKITFEGSIVRGEDGIYRATSWNPVLEMVVSYDLDPNSYDPDGTEPIRPFNESLVPSDGYWVYRGYLMNVKGSETFTLDEVMLKIKHSVIRREKSFSRMRRELDAFENIERSATARREHIPDSVRLFVWQRDQGKCVRCGGTENLEFDHIIPVAKGGSNTERNVQLLCERCNRTKGATI